MDLRWEILAGYGPLFLNGLWMTIQLTIVSIGAGLLLGVLLGLVSSSRDAPAPKSAPLAWALKAARAITVGYVAFFRGTPLFVQVLLVHFALMPALIHPDHGLLLAGEAARTFRNLPLDLGSPSEPLYLVLYGTGFRNRSSLDRVRVSLRGLDIPVLYAGPQGQFPGLDQINIGPLPPGLRGAGQLAFQVEVDAELSNRVTIDVF